MKIQEIKVMRGPNYWSIEHEKLVVCRVEPAKPHDSKISFSQFKERLLEKVPLLNNFDQKELANLATAEEWLPFVALSLQKMGGMHVDYHSSEKSSNNKGTVYLFEYIEEEAGVHAAQTAANLINAILDQEEYDIDKDIDELTYIRKYEFLGLSTGSVVEEAQLRGIPYTKAYDDTFIILGYGSRQKRIQATIANTTGYIGVDIAGDKDGTKKILKAASIAVPDGVKVESEDELLSEIKSVGFPMVTKPLDGNHGRGITLDIRSLEEAIAGFKIAKEVSDVVILERYVTGYDYRILVVNYKFVAAVKRVPPAIIGDGTSTIKQLIDQLNEDPRRQPKIGNILQQIEIDEITINILKKHGLNIDTVLDEGRKIYIKETGNVSAGAIPIDATEELHPANIFQAERIAKLVGLDICGIDVMSPDLSVPLNENGGAVIEVNAAPGIRMHMEPAEGRSRDVAAAIIDMLFPNEQNGLIPIVAVTGTNGKTTVTRLVAHMAKTAGYVPGFTSTEGIYINDFLMEKGDCSGPKSAKYILKDTSVDFAVLECARGGIIRSGLAFKNCDVGIFINVTEDHLGLNDVNTLEEMTRVKSVVPKSVKKDGYAVLNAEDHHVAGVSKDLKCNIAYFAISSANPIIQKHIAKGGLCAYVENGHIVIHDKEVVTKIENLENIPLTHGGKAGFMVQNTLPAVIAAYTQNISIENIRTALQTFESNAATNPGRINFFEFKDFRIMLDYAHNPAGLEAITSFIKAQEADWNIGILTAPGDRRNKDIKKIGAIAATTFDHIIIRNDDDLRGREEKEIHELLIEGINTSDRNVKVEIIRQEKEAIAHAMQDLKPNSLISIFSEHPSEAISTINELHAKEHEKQPNTKENDYQQ